MKTPIADFVAAYREKNPIRLHMPGHKGAAILGCEAIDITEVAGADALYEAEGIIAESEENAAGLFGSGRTVYSAEGSSQCIRAMVYLAVTGSQRAERPWILAARNAHKAFLYALALCDADVAWLWPEGSDSLCSCPIRAEQVEHALKHAETLPAAVYLTSPDYLGRENPIADIAEVCHRYGVLLLVDNAHGAYLRFLPQSRHPMDLGADLCCDSAHKTLPVLTGGAYLHMGKHAPEALRYRAKAAMALFGSTSPSYLILSSLDRCNAYLGGDFPGDLAKAVEAVRRTKAALQENGWYVLPSEPMKITIRAAAGRSGEELARMLSRKGIEPEYADPEHLVLMPSVMTKPWELQALSEALGKAPAPPAVPLPMPKAPGKQVLTPREAVFAPQEVLPTEASLNRICASPTVGCPPAIPIAVSGERIEAETIALFQRYGVKTVAVVKE